MVKEFLMKKLLISLGVFACVTVNAQTASDSVVMTVAGKQVPLSEFIFLLCGRFNSESFPVVSFSPQVDATGVFGIARDHT